MRFVTQIPYFWWECHFLCTFTLSVTLLGRNYSFAFGLVWVWNLVCKVMVDYIMGGFMLCAFCQIFLGWSHQERRDSGACATYGGGGVHTGFWLRNLEETPLGRPRCWWENNINGNLEEIGWEDVDRSDLAQDMGQVGVLMNMVMNLRVL
jgi:hypothetical protein